MLTYSVSDFCSYWCQSHESTITKKFIVICDGLYRQFIDNIGHLGRTLYASRQCTHEITENIVKLKLENLIF